MKVPEMESAEDWSDIPALDPDWNGENRESGGGELFVVQETMKNPDMRVLIENAGVCYHSLSELVAATGYQDAPSESMVHSLCWQALRDLKTSMFLAMSGRYRSANFVQRGVIELIGSGIYYEKQISSETEEGWEDVRDWIRNEENGPAFKHIKGALTDVVPYLGELIYTTLEENQDARNLRIHTPVGGQVHDILFSDDDRILTRPWCSHLNERELKAWYVGYMTDIYLISAIVAEYFDFDSVSDSFEYITQCYEDLAGEEVAEGIKTDHVVDLTPDSSE